MLVLFKSSFLIFLAFLLSGCLDIDQQINIVKNQLTYKAEIKLDAKIAALSEKNNESFCGGLEKPEKEGILVDVKESMSGGNIVCTLTAQGDIDKFENFTALGKNKSDMVKITKVDKNTYKIESILDVGDKKTDSAEMNGMSGMMDAFLAGRNVSWTVNAPKILESNGKISEDGKSVTWSVPLAVAFKTSQKFYAVVKQDVSFIDSIIDFFKRIIDAILGLFKSEKQVITEVNKPVAIDSSPAATSSVTTPVEEINQTEEVAPVVENQTSEVVEEIQNAETIQESISTQDNNPFTPSFDCSKATTGQERLICSDRELSRLDVEMSNAYTKARQLSSDVQTLRAEQREWVKGVQKSCSDKECLVTAYSNRIAQLTK